MLFVSAGFRFGLEGRIIRRGQGRGRDVRCRDDARPAPVLDRRGARVRLVGYQPESGGQLLGVEAQGDAREVPEGSGEDAASGL